MHSRRWLVNAALVALIGLFALLGYRVDFETDSGESAGMLDLAAEDVRRLEIRTAEADFSLRRDGQHWMLENPIQWPANQFNVEHLLNITDARTESSFSAEGQDLARFGLDQPIAELRLNDIAVAFGINHTIGERRYTRVGPSVYLLPDVYLPFMLQGVLALVDRRLLPPSLLPQSLDLGQIELTRDADAGWRVSNGAAVEEDWITRRIANWQNLEASRVRSLDPSLAPQQRVQARLENGASIEFQVLSSNPELVIAQPELGLQFHFSAEQYRQLLALPDETAS